MSLCGSLNGTICLASPICHRVIKVLFPEIEYRFMGVIETTVEHGVINQEVTRFIRLRK